VKRRELILASAGIAGGMIARVGRAATPCPPPQVSVSGGTSASTACATSQSYTTNFAGTENPLSEAGVWTTGGVTGLDWTDPQKSGGMAYGTQIPHTAPPYNDSVACLSGFPPNHYAQATLSNTGASGDIEVELFLRFKITAHNARGYEIDIVSGYNVLNVVRWNGPLNNWTSLNGNGISINSSLLANGSVWYAEIVGNTITVKCNGNLVWTGTDTTWTDGNPGIGFYRDISMGTPSAANTFGASSFTASSL